MSASEGERRAPEEDAERLATVCCAQRHILRSDLTDEIFALVDEKAPRKWMRT